MKNYNEISDDIVLIKASDKGNQQAFSILYKKYMRIGEVESRIFFANRGYEKHIADEYIEELDLIFLNAFRKFNRKLHSFSSYFRAILNNELNRYVGRFLRNGDGLRHYKTLDQNVDHTPLYELIEDNTISLSAEVTNLLDAGLKMSSFENGFQKKKKDLAKATVILKAQGYTLKQIADLLNVSESTISRLYVKFRESLSLK